MTKSTATEGVWSALVIVIMAMIAGTMTEQFCGSALGSDPAPSTAGDQNVGKKIDPSSPRDLTAVGGDDVVRLKWRAPADTAGIETFYIIQKSFEGAPWKNLTMVGSGQTKHSDTIVANGHETSYRIVFVHDGIWSPPSNVATATPRGAPYPPAYLTFRIAGSAVMITVHPPLFDRGSPVTGYVLFRKSDISPVFVEIARLNSTDPRFTDEGVAGNRTVSYYAIAENACGMSEKSRVHTLTDIPNTEMSGSERSGWIGTVLVVTISTAGSVFAIAVLVTLYRIMKMKRGANPMRLYIAAPSPTYMG